MPLSITEDIRTITELKRDTGAILSQLHATGYRQLLHGNYRFIFRVQDDAVMVLRVTHGARLLQL